MAFLSSVYMNLSSFTCIRKSIPATLFRVFKEIVWDRECQNAYVGELLYYYVCLCVSLKNFCVVLRFLFFQMVTSDVYERGVKTQKKVESRLFSSFPKCYFPFIQSYSYFRPFSSPSFILGE